MYFIKLYFLSLTGRKFLLKTGCLLALIMLLPQLEASPKSLMRARQYHDQIKIVHEWLYNYCEKPGSTEIKKTTGKLIHLVGKFQHSKVKYRSEEQWLKDIFYEVHEKLLKRYKIFSTVPELLEGGTYDCVSGTALYALICELLYIPYAIRETEYHVYLLASVDGKKVLIESTDPVYGFVSQPDTIQSLMQAYHEDKTSMATMHGPVNNTVFWTQLAGLQYFNKAVQLCNNRKFAEAISYLNRATQYYRSSRITSFKDRVLQLNTSYPKYSGNP